MVERGRVSLPRKRCHVHLGYTPSGITKWGAGGGGGGASRSFGKRAGEGSSSALRRGVFWMKRVGRLRLLVASPPAFPVWSVKSRNMGGGGFAPVKDKRSVRSLYGRNVDRFDGGSNPEPVRSSADPLRRRARGKGARAESGPLPPHSDGAFKNKSSLP